MDPVNGPLFCYNLNRGVLQVPDVIVLTQQPTKTFSLEPPEKSEKTKKDIEKKKKDKREEKKDNSYPYRN